jgi:tetratricopeptide (TPR) repeat protein
MKALLVLLAWVAFAGTGWAQMPTPPGFKLVLADHPGALEWTARGFKVVENSAKANGAEIGVRAEKDSPRIMFLGFLFLVSEAAPLTSAKCRDEALAQARKDDSNLKNVQTSETARPGGLPVALASYTTKARDAIQYEARGFIASGDLCGDLEFYSPEPIHASDANLADVFSSYRLDPAYKPKFGDVFLFASVLYEHKNYRAAAPIFEEALAMVPKDGSPFPSEKVARRVTTDQAGMSYGISGDLGKSRAVFQAGIAADPDYPMYYYNLACADAEEKKLGDARLHLEQAFARKSNVIAGETMPNPAEDDSFLPYKGDKEFWSFIEHLAR